MMALSNYQMFYDDLLTIIAGVALLVVLLFLISKSLTMIVQRLQKRTPLAKAEQQAQFLSKVHLAQRVIVRSLLVLFVCGSLSWIGAGGYYIYQGQDFLSSLTQLITQSVPLSFWLDLGKGLVAIVVLTIVARRLIRWLKFGFTWLQKRLNTLSFMHLDETKTNLITNSLRKILVNSIYLAVIATAMWLLPVPIMMASTLWMALKVYLILAIGNLIVKIVPMIIDALDVLSEKYIRVSALPPKPGLVPPTVLPASFVL